MDEGEYGYRALDELVAREESEMPDIIGAVRAGLTFSLKEQCGAALIKSIEFADADKFYKEVLTPHANIFCLGDLRAQRIPIYCINMFHTRLSDGRTKLIHYTLLSCMLNDLFGIQSRPGCMCAGSYMRYMLAFTDVDEYIEAFHVNRAEFKRPGFCRLNFHYTVCRSSSYSILCFIAMCF